MLCSLCTTLDIRTLLITSSSQPLEDRTYLYTPAAGQTHSTKAIRPGIPRFFAHQASLLALRESAKNVGCELCRAIWAVYERNAQPYELQEDVLKEGVDGVGVAAGRLYVGTNQWDMALHALPHVAVSLVVDERSGGKMIAWFEVYAKRGSEPRDHADLLARSIYDYSGSNECLGLGRRWLDDCVENHGGCKPYGPSLAQLPTRVIDVKSENPKVVDGKGISEQYAALSYCWGGNTDFKMTQDTQAMLRKGVPLADFPATLRDSIIVTRKLDISYLWIDALCIVQDSTEDWAYEAARMRNVYKGAIVTIAAAAAPKSTAGFFQHRQQSPMTCSLEWRNGDPTPPTVFLRPGSEIWDETMRSSILNTRGWTLQETLLAPRTLWFGSQQISFECSNGTVDEAGRTTEVIEEYRSKKFIRDISMEATTHRNAIWFKLFSALRLPPIINISYPSPRLMLRAKDRSMWRIALTAGTSFYLRGLLETPGGMTMTYFDFWNEIVRRYTSRSLTNPTDVLPALSGLADEFQRATGDEYIAGMWKTDMVRSLAWSRHTLAKNAKEGGQNNVYLAPSWSWASVAGASVAFAIGVNSWNKLTYSAKILNTSVVLATGDPYGTVKSGYITLRALLLPFDTDNVEQPDQPSSKFPNMLAWISRLLQNRQLGSEYRQQHRGFAGQKFALLHLCSWTDLNWEQPPSDLFCLLLESCNDDDATIWRRVAGLGFKVVTGFGSKLAEDQVKVNEEFQKAPWQKKTVKIV